MSTRAYDDYFRARGIEPGAYSDYVMPAHLRQHLPRDKHSPILDIGCGYCQDLKSLRELGYTNLQGMDLSDQSVEYGIGQGLNVVLAESIESFIQRCQTRYDLVIMSHVIEHIGKERIIGTLDLIRSRLLARSGALYLATPNAQSPTNSYWAYEDFTHTTIFTAGSMIYVLKQAGYHSIAFLDPNGWEHLPPIKKTTKRVLQYLYRTNARLWNRVMSSSYHRPSPEIYAWELRVLAR